MEHLARYFHFLSLSHKHPQALFADNAAWKVKLQSDYHFILSNYNIKEVVQYSWLIAHIMNPGYVYYILKNLLHDLQSIFMGLIIFLFNFRPGQWWVCIYKFCLPILVAFNKSYTKQAASVEHSIFNMAAFIYKLNPYNSLTFQMWSMSCPTSM